MRTTVRLDDHLLAAAKQRATEQGTTLTGLIEEALRETLGRRTATPSARAKLPTFRGNGLRPGVDLDSSAGLRELMERGLPVGKQR